MTQKYKPVSSGLAIWILALVLIPHVYSAPSTEVTYLSGEVFIGAAETGPWRPLQEGTNILEGQFVKTGRKGRVELTMPDGSLVRLASDTLFEIIQADFPDKKTRKFSVKLFLGKMWAKITGRIGAPRGIFNAHTPTAVAGVRGTVYNLKVAQDTSTDIWVYEGKVGIVAPLFVEGGPKAEIAWPREVSEKKWEEIILVRLQRLHVGADGRPDKPRAFDPSKEKDDWTAWNLERDSL
ncbi:MAG: FecR domain-containing protein [Desulfobacterales bacterium]